MSASAPFPETKAGLVSSLNGLLAELPESFWAWGEIDPSILDAALLNPARDILGRTGKGLRARLVEHSWRLAGGDREGVPELLPLLVELLHAGSLVIDDIEDDSRLRRGQTALHRVYGLPLALNMGNWLYFVALALLSRVAVPPELKLALHEDAGLALLRSHQGQALDLGVRVTSAKRSEIKRLVASSTRLKTGSLMQLSALIGARASGGTPEAVDAISRFGAELGVALQMLDDWSGISVESRREKGVEDIKLARPTWPWVWLAEGSDELVYAETVRQLRSVSIDWEAGLILDRMRVLLETRAPARIQAQLELALGCMHAGIVESLELDAVRDYVGALERAFS